MIEAVRADESIIAKGFGMDKGTGKKIFLEVFGNGRAAGFFCLQWEGGQ